MISNSRYQSFLETKICFKKLSTFENNPKVVKSQKIVKKEVTGHLFLTPLFSKFELNVLKLEAFFDRFLHLIF